MLHLYIRRDFLEMAFFRQTEDSVPVRFAGTLYWLDAPFPWTVDTSVLFHAVVVCPVVHLDDLEMDLLIDRFVNTSTLGLLEILEYLEVRSPFRTLFHLPAGIHGFEFLVEPFHVLFRYTIEIVHC